MSSLEFRLKKVDETRNYFYEEIKHNDLTSGKFKKTFKNLSYVEHLLILASTITSCVSISAFASVGCVPVGIMSSAVGLKIYAITARIKKYKLITKKRKKKHDKIVLLGKTKLETIEVLISKALMDSYIIRDEFISVNVVLKEYEMEAEIK